MRSTTTEQRRHARRPTGTARARRIRARVQLTPAPHLGEPRRAELHLATYVVGNLLFWTLWSAISVSTDHWYWWPIVPLAGWTVVLALHLWLAHRSPSQ